MKQFACYRAEHFYLNMKSFGDEYFLDIIRHYSKAMYCHKTLLEASESLLIEELKINIRTQIHTAHESEFIWGNCYICMTYGLRRSYSNLSRPIIDVPSL